MNKPLIWTLGVGLLVIGGGLVLAQRGTAVAAADEDAPLFVTQPQGLGRLLQLQAKEPLRGVRWLPPMSGGWSLCQVSTQSDRQVLTLFQGGQLARTFSLPRLQGTSEGFYRQAEIREAAMASNTLLLLVKAEGGRRDAAVVMALSLEGDLRWAHRTQAEHLIAREDSVWAWGSTGAQRLPITLAQGEHLNPKSERPGLPEPLVWPYEAANPTALLPTSAGFLVTHGKGLSAWRSESGWTHTPSPTPSPLGFSAPKGSVVECENTLYWQPEPGTLVKVTPEGTVVGPEALPIPEPADKDSALLKLLGCDADGRLWFSLASPSLAPQPMATVPPAMAPSAESPAVAPAASSVETRLAYEAHLKGPMDRIYSWKPGDKALRLITWSKAWPALGAPATVAIPTAEVDFRPEAQGLLLGGEQERWWLPLKALP